MDKVAHSFWLISQLKFIETTENFLIKIIKNLFQILKTKLVKKEMKKFLVL